MEDNAITSIPPLGSGGYGLANLRVLLLARNAVTKIEPGTFAGLDSLVQMYVFPCDAQVRRHEHKGGFAAGPREPQDARMHACTPQPSGAPPPPAASCTRTASDMGTHRRVCTTRATPADARRRPAQTEG